MNGLHTTKAMRKQLPTKVHAETHGGHFGFSGSAQIPEEKRRPPPISVVSSDTRRLRVSSDSKVLDVVNSDGSASSGRNSRTRATRTWQR